MLVAFEAVARLGGVGLAADELNTSQSAVSRHLKALEEDLDVRLFERSGRGIALSSAGRTYHEVVSSVLERLASAHQALRGSTPSLTIACTHEVSHLLIMPEFRTLRRAIGSETNIRILTSEYDALPAMIHQGVDIVFRYADTKPDAMCVPVVTESVFPIASPSFAAEHADILRRDPSDWNGVPRLSLTKNNFGWATWDTWFGAAAGTVPPAPTEAFDNYVYLLESAAAGGGLALGWAGFVDRYMANGALVAVSPTVVTRPTRLYAVRTAKGIQNRRAAACLDFLARLFPDPSAEKVLSDKPG